MDFFGFASIVVVFATIGFVMGRNYQRNGRFVPDGIHRFVEMNRPMPFKMRGMGGLMLAAFALMAALLFYAVAAESYGDPGPAFMATLCFIAYWILVPIWVYRDAMSRGERAWAWGLMTLFTNVLGLFSYLITRPEKPRACRRCGYLLREEFVVCPYCGPQAGLTCGTCQSAVEPGWIYCPFCQGSITSENGPAAFGPSSPTGGEKSSLNVGISDLPIVSS